jgi:hypothetical protein
VCHEEGTVLGRPTKPSVLFDGLGLVRGSTGCANCLLFGPEETRVYGTPLCSAQTRYNKTTEQKKEEKIDLKT